MGQMGLGVWRREDGRKFSRILAGATWWVVREGRERQLCFDEDWISECGEK